MNEALCRKIKNHPLAQLGPGLITGVADDDPSGIATYSQAGAQFGLNILWTMPLTFPLMVAIQLMCAQIGRVTGRGLAANIKKAFSPNILRFVVLLLIIANTLNIAADVSVMGEVAELVTGLDRHIMTTFFVFVTLVGLIFVPYHRYVWYLKWLSLSLLAYAAVLFTVHVPWHEVFLRTIVPNFHMNSEGATVIVAIFGTTISPYLFFWQASQEVEDMAALESCHSLIKDPASAPEELRRIKWGTWSGMFYSNLTAFFIILATAVTLNVQGVTDIQTAAQAANALRPLAGDFAFLLFALGIIGVGLLGVPVLAGASGYAVSETLGWTFGLGKTLKEARGFYLVIAITILSALVIQYSPISSIKALFWSAVINGIVAIPLIILIILLVSKKSIMGNFTSSRWTIFLGSIGAAIMAAAVIIMLIPEFNR